MRMYQMSYYALEVRINGVIVKDSLWKINYPLT